jgi:hypothetical protein
MFSRAKQTCHSPIALLRVSPWQRVQGEQGNHAVIIEKRDVNRRRR